LADANQIGDLTHTARPDMIPGAELRNSLWDRNCPIGAGCQPFVIRRRSRVRRSDESHCAAHAGWRSRTLGADPGLLAAEELPVGEGKRRLQFRADGLNLLNHPVFRVFPTTRAAPTLWRSEYRGPIGGRLQLVATANNQPQSTTTAGTALLTQINTW